MKRRVYSVQYLLQSTVTGLRVLVLLTNSYVLVIEIGDRCIMDHSLRRIIRLLGTFGCQSVES